jgi:hypothetical protein
VRDVAPTITECYHRSVLGAWATAWSVILKGSAPACVHAWFLRCVVKCVELRGVASKMDVVEGVGLHDVA